VVATRADTQPLAVKAFVDREIRDLVALTSSPVVEVSQIRLLGTTAGSASVFEPSYRSLAVASFNRALELSPGNENTYVAFAQFYAAGGDLATGLTLLRKAMALAPDADGLRMNFVRLALRAGVAAEDDLEFAGRYVASQRDLVEPAVQYLRDGDWALALMVLDEMVRRDPDNAQLREQRESVARRLQAPAQPSAIGR
jgi:Tfp pilus assembly protein PilF